MNDISKKIIKLTDQIIETKQISQKQADFLTKISNRDSYALFFGATRLRNYFRKPEPSLCAIVNAKSGNCSEDCKYCAQSAHYKTGVTCFSFIGKEKILESVKKAESIKAQRLGIVTSGEGILDKKEIEGIKDALIDMKKISSLERCASLGIMSFEYLLELKNAGLERFHHNLETSKSFFPKICTTHSYEARLNTIKNAKKAGLFVCSGGIFGLGEDFSQRLELAFELKNLDVDSIPLNFLCAIKGTPLEGQKPLKPLEILKIISICRFILPDKELKVCAGRQSLLGTLEAMIYYAGADGMMVGDYLTIKGGDVLKDNKMLEDLGLI